MDRIDIPNYELSTLLNQAWYKPGFENDGSGRWDDFGDVTERLNSPELIDFYESRNFSYRKIRLISIDEYKNPRILDNTLHAYIHHTGIYKKDVYLNIYSYYGDGYLTN